MTSTKGRTSGTRYEALPPLRECWRRGLSLIDIEAKHVHGTAFRALAPEAQDALLHAVDGGEITASATGGIFRRSVFSAICC